MAINRRAADRDGRLITAYQVASLALWARLKPTTPPSGELLWTARPSEGQQGIPNKDAKPLKRVFRRRSQ